MLPFRKEYLRLPIHRQIQIGVALVSLCVCILSLFLLTLSSFIILNLSYQDTLSIIDDKDNENIEEIGSLSDLAIINMIEMKKFSIQFMKNFIKNNKQNKAFINNIKTDNQNDDESLINVDSESYKKLSTWTDDEKTKKIVYKVLKPPESPEKEEELKYYLQILKIAIPLFKKILDYRFIRLSGIKIFDFIEITSNELSTVFLYPASRFKLDPKNEYNYSNLIKSTYLIASQSSYDYQNTINPYTYNQNFSYYYREAILQNPLVTLLYRNMDFMIPYADTFDNSPLIISTKGITYKDLPSKYNNTNLSEFLMNPDNVLNIISGDSYSSMLELYALSLRKIFKYAKVLVSVNIRHHLTETKDILVTTIPCLYFRHLYNKYYTGEDLNVNNIYSLYFDYIDFLKEIKAVDVCFKDDLAKQKFSKFFLNFNNITGEEVYSHIIRKAKFNLFNTNTFFPLKKWKIFKFKSPNTKNLINTRTKFMKNYNLNIYMIKNPHEQSKKNDKLKNIYLQFFMYIISFNAILWSLCLFVILILLSKTASQISQPIKDIINMVHSVQLTEKKKRKKNRIKFKDDKDIDDFFKLCTNLIQGGFSALAENEIKERSKSKADDFYEYNSYNNVAIVKSNNLIIQESLIENKYETSSIFLYEKNEDLNDSKNNPILVKKGTTLDNTNNSDYLIGYSRLNSTYNNNMTSNFMKSFRRNDTHSDLLNNETVSDSLLLDSIFGIVEREDDSINDKNYLYEIFMNTTNKGEDLKYIMCKNNE